MTNIKIKVGDKVLIAKQPSNQWATLVGEKGIVENIYGDFADITTYRGDDWYVIQGTGTVPLDCLKLIYD